MTSSTLVSTRRRLGALLVAACYCGAAGAVPTSPKVAAGQATFSQQGTVFTITNTPGTIINWQTFSIDAGETTQFIQQSADSAVLNRVLGQDPTKILGALQSNGKVFLINPNGILFGQGSRVDVNGLVASSLNITDADFLAGNKTFQAGAVAGTVRNEGSITTPKGGQVFLIAPDVENAGVITTPKGDVVLAAGNSVQLVDSSDPDLRVEISAPAEQALNLGQVIAKGGRIGIYGALVSQRGTANADSAAVGENGRIVLKASGAVTLDAASVTSAGGGDTADGGTVKVLGEQVAVVKGAGIDASGRNGGTVLVGDDGQPNGKHAQTTSVESGSSIHADGKAGNGGKVALAADSETKAHGTVSAKGTAQGGSVGTSGYAVDVDGIAVDASGDKGKNGTWQLAPYDIEVVAGGTAGAGDVVAGAQAAAGSVTRVAPGTLTAAGTDVLLQAQHDLTVTDALDAAGSVRAQAGNSIYINAQVSAGGDLDFRAGNVFLLGAGGTLKTGNNIGIGANQITLAGNIVGNGQLPTLSLLSADPYRAISIGAANESANTLVLDAAALQRLSPNLAAIKVGDGGHQAAVTVDGALSAASDVVLANAGDIRVRAPVDLSANAASQLTVNQYAVGGIVDIEAPVTASKSVLLQGDRLTVAAAVTAPAVSLMPNSLAAHVSLGGGDGFVLDQAALDYVKATDITVGGLAGNTAGIDVVGPIALAGVGTPMTLRLDAGAGALNVKAPLTTSGTLALGSTAGIYETGDGMVGANAVVVRGGQVVLTGANKIGTLAGTTDADLFHVTTAGDLRIGMVDGLSGVMAPNAGMQFISGGAVTFDAGLGGAIATVDAAGIYGNGLLRVGTLSLTSSAGIGTGDNPLKTQAGTLLAYNHGAGGQPINVANMGPLTVVRAVQDGVGNTGAIAIDSVGGMTVPVYESGDAVKPASGEVRTVSGDISLTTHSPLTINGQVTTTSGNVRLLADNGGALTITPGARVATASGSVSMTAGSTQIAPDSVAVSSPDKALVNGAPLTPPTLDVCLANRAAPGCAPVLAAAVQACVTDPAGPRCGEILPTYDVCAANPATAGCAPVVQAHDAITACMADPSAPGCALILPPLDKCRADAGVYGCKAVLAVAALDACVANPNGAGCGAILPTYDVCAAKPATAGCAPVVQTHDAITACMANPAAPGCATILPPLDKCRADAGVYGCKAVLAAAAFDACVANPSGAGCAGILPSLDVCKATPTVAGCAQVLALGFTACLANPHDPSCTGILPTLTQCQGNTKLPGCDVVLPTLTQCIGSPSLQGCDVRLPSLAACAAAPGTAGCEAVLPTAAFCTTHPGDATCVTFSGSTAGKDTGAPVAQAVQTTVQLINTAAPAVAASGAGEGGAADGKAVERVATTAKEEHTGVKNEKPAAKLYCN
ncbi:filamentous hemagglutinin N-terminal domain-containing protein [Massilia pinisoli]|uniref:Filamentous hemagglutinin N-terminal domain-containing protein n=1 Tax=Massilia pinisoli TaxID=1772194 RepID=A0ABT1ZPS8_9BURK|nr:filamentous hemagglutinin N-terminal domain-containing protein [Massilia pinisoli]MCS0581913.1 filamentous hemagglutinin N-terminal domain-containing protein [Massilia pinisoli]